MPLPWIAPEAPADSFPPVTSALREPNGLLAAGGDLSPARLLAAYRRGIFPWYNAEEPILWWSPDPRSVLYPTAFHCTRSLRKTLQRGHFRVTVDQAFMPTLQACAQVPRAGATGTWITPQMQAAYGLLHTLGWAHSIETWQDEQLVGGLYGVAIGKIFYGESMWHRTTDASKTALAVLSALLAQWDFGLIDCQLPTPHLQSLGACTLAREAFLAVVQHHSARPHTAALWQQTAAQLDLLPWLRGRM